MRHFTWSPEHEVFIAQIDAEHRDLFQIAEGLEQTMEAHAPSADIKEHLQALTAHLEDHFSHEEWLMQSVSYPSYGWHKQQHDTARRRLKLFAPLIEGGDAEAADVFLEFLAGWMQDHTGVTDRMMAAFVRNYERSHATDAFERWGAPSRSGGGLRVRTAAATADVGPFPKTMRFCKVCGDQTTHEIRARGLACVKCAERSVSADLERD